MCAGTSTHVGVWHYIQGSCSPCLEQEGPCHCDHGGVIRAVCEGWDVYGPPFRSAQGSEFLAEAAVGRNATRNGKLRDPYLTRCFAGLGKQLPHDGLLQRGA